MDYTKLSKFKDYSLLTSYQNRYFILLLLFFIYLYYVVFDILFIILTPNFVKKKISLSAIFLFF